MRTYLTPDFITGRFDDRSLRAKITNAVETGKKILIFPDVDAYDYWKEKFKVRPI